MRRKENIGKNTEKKDQELSKPDERYKTTDSSNSVTIQLENYEENHRLLKTKQTQIENT